MMRQMGAEAFQGIGGGIVKKQSEKLLDDAIKDFNAGRNGAALAKCKTALDIDPNNIDVYIEMSQRMPDQHQKSIELLEKAEKIGKKQLIEILGRDAFDKSNMHYGTWWRLITTRPYMRALHGLMELKALTNQFASAAEHGLELMRLCHGDNQGNRTQLPSFLLLACRFPDAMNFALNWTESETGPPEGGINFTRNKLTLKQMGHNPSDELLASVRSVYASEMLYSLAISTFFCVGECRLANEALYAAAARNKHIMWHLCMGKRRPQSYETASCEINGPVPARNYLLMAHPLWTVDSAKAWWTKQTSAVESGLQKCDSPGCNSRDQKEDKFKRCGACKLVTYCSVECQKKDWKNHKFQCDFAKENRERLKTMGRT